MTRYQHIVRAVAEQPWAIRPATLAVIIDLLALRAGGVRLEQAEIDDRLAAAQARGPRTGARAAGVAVLPVYGILAPRASIFAQTSTSGTGVDQLRAALRDAVANPEVGSILLDIDSPGGQVDQIPEFASELREARKSKPIVAVANTDAASAAYWLGAQASEFYVTPSGQVGSIGVFSAHEDVSALQEREGRKISLVSAGKYKVEGNPFEPLGVEARENLQSVVNGYYDMFLRDVARGRGVELDKVRKGFGQGRMVMPKAAVEEGMVNDIATFDEALSRALRLAAQPNTATASSWGDGVAAAWAEGITSGLGNGPYSEHGERVFRTVREFAERTRERKAERLAESGRSLSAGDRQRLSELAAEMRGAAADLDELASLPSEEASRVEAEFLAISHRIGAPS